MNAPVVPRYPIPPLLDAAPAEDRLDWRLCVVVPADAQPADAHPRPHGVRVSGYRAGSGMVLTTEPCPCCRLGARMGGVKPYDAEYLGHPDTPLDPPLPRVQDSVVTGEAPLLRAGDGLIAADIELFRSQARAIRAHPLAERPLRLQRDWPAARVRLLQAQPAPPPAIHGEPRKRDWLQGEPATVVERRKTDLTLLGDPCSHCGLREIREGVPTEAVEYLGHLALPSERRAENVALVASKKAGAPAEVSEMPGIQNIGKPLPSRRRRRRELTPTRQSRKMFDRLWPEPDWAAEAAGDPWGAAIRRAVRERARHHRVYRALKGNEAWYARNVQVHRRIAERLSGEAALKRIAEGFRYLIAPQPALLARSDPDRWAGQRKWGRLRPDVISANAMAYAVAGHRRAIAITTPGSGLWYFFRSKLKRAASLAEAIAALQPAAPARKRSTKRPHLRFVFRVYPTEGGFGIGRLVGPKPLRRRLILRTYPSRAEAEAAFHNPTELNILGHAFQAWRNCPKGHHIEWIAAERWENVRRGPPRREGDVFLEEFDAAFAPRGIAFGTSLPQWERQRMLNQLYDQAMDLAECLGIAPADMFLRRRIALALGCWGNRGVPRGFYNRPNAVIAFSRRKGGQGFAHEWFHALDHHALDVKGRKTRHLSSGFVRRLDAARTEGQPTYTERCKAFELRSKTSRLYFSTPIEMGARAAEALLHRLARKRNWRGSPVPNLPCWEEWRDQDAAGHFWYPTPAEIDRVAEDVVGAIKRALDGLLRPAEPVVLDFHVNTVSRPWTGRKRPDGFDRRARAIAASPAGRETVREEEEWA